MTEIYESIYPANHPLIDNLLYRGTHLFVGAPKIGKSFLMAQIAYHVSKGLPLWNYPVRKGTVLYLALEDDFSRLQQRMYRMFGTESTDNLHCSVFAKNFSDGLDEQLGDFVAEHADTSLIIIDTLQKVRECGGDRYSYSSDYEAVTRIKQFGERNGVCILLVHHTRKQAADDCFDTISGTNGLLGASDGAFILQKNKRTGTSATLDVSGRDQPDQKLYLDFDRERCVWNFVKAETEFDSPPSDPILEAVATLLTANVSEWSGNATELLARLGVDMQPNTLTRRLNVNANRLLDEYGIQYMNTRTHAGRQIRLNLMK